MKNAKLTFRIMQFRISGGLPQSIRGKTGEEKSQNRISRRNIIEIARFCRTFSLLSEPACKEGI